MQTKFRRINASKKIEYLSYKLPKFLFQDEFITLSSDAKVLYAILLREAGIAASAGKVNPGGDAYITSSLDEMSARLQVSGASTKKAKNELKKIGLLEGELGQAYLLLPEFPDGPPQKPEKGSEGNAKG